MKKTIIIAGSILGVCLAVYIGFGFFFQTHFYFRSTINGVSSSAETSATMQPKLTDAAKEYHLTLVESGEKKEILTTTDLGMVVDIEQDKIQEILEEQNGFLWGYYLFVGKEYVDEDLIRCDKKKIQQSVRTLDCVQDKNPVKTKNANVTYKNGSFEITEEIYGTELDVKDLTERVYKSALSLKKELDLKEDGCYKQPQYTADSKEVKKLQKELNNYMKAEIVYQVGKEKETIPAKTIGAWLSGDDNMKPAFDEEAMLEFVSEMSKKYDTYGQPKQLNTQYGVTVTVPGGNYGWRIDKEKEVAQLKKDIATGKKVQRDFVYQYTAASREGNDYGNSYVEINKTAQHVYLIINGAVVMDTPMVSGKEDGQHDTPTGAYRITYCEKNATLRGPGYATPVSYWMPFNGDIGLHDANWQKSFGGNRYREGYGSHGCVNLPVSAAGTIFSYVSAGFPVLMYDLPGTETVDTLTRQAADNCKNAINAIGGVTLDSAAAIGAARGAYDALTESGKACVDNYQVLLDAEASYAAQAAQAAQASAAAQAAQVEAQARAQASAVDMMIQNIGPVTTAEQEGAIAEAERAYAALSEQAKGYVKNYAILQAARQKVNSL